MPTDTIRVSRGAPIPVGLKWFDGLPPEPAFLFEPVGEAGVKVPHQAANIQCNVIVRERKDHDTGITYQLACKKRAGHPTLKGEKRHVAIDVRIVASTNRIVHEERYKPNAIPAGVDLSLTLPHDCANHLKDVEEVARGY